MEYDDRGRIELAVSFEGHITHYVYDQYGRLAAREFFDKLTQYGVGFSRRSGNRTKYTYDDLNRHDEMVSFVDDGTVNGVYDSGSDTLIAGLDYTVRDDGKRSAVTETFAGGLTNTINWTYDNLGRLTEEDFDSSNNDLDYVHRHTFDLTGRRCRGGRSVAVRWSRSGSRIRWSGSGKGSPGVRRRGTRVWWTCCSRCSEEFDTTPDETSMPAFS